MFAGSCIGVILLVMVLEFLRRGSYEFDRYLLRNHAITVAAKNIHGGPGNEEEESAINGGSVSVAVPFTPNPVQQAIRALLHMLQFAIAYIIMLLAMYFNGYIIISIFIGAFLGNFVFSWYQLGTAEQAQEVTYCCG
jgi:copper transporter 1